MTRRGTPRWAPRATRRVAACLFAVVAMGSFVVLGIASPARAQLDSARASAAARAIFSEGVACAERAEWPCAIEHFERAYGLRPSPVISYNLGMALLQVGRLVEGTEMLGRVSRDEEASAELRSDALRAAEGARPRIGRLTVRVTGALSAVSLTLDGHALPRELLGAASPADPGTHVVIALRDGLEIARAETTLSDGGTGEVVLELPAFDLALPGALAPPPVAEPARSDDTPWIVLGIGGGVLVIGGAIVLGVVLGQPQAPAPFDGSLGHVEIGR